MISETPLGKVIGANAIGAISGSHQVATLGSLLICLLVLGTGEQFRLQQ